MRCSALLTPSVRQGRTAPPSRGSCVGGRPQAATQQGSMSGHLARRVVAPHTKKNRVPTRHSEAAGRRIRILVLVLFCYAKGRGMRILRSAQNDEVGALGMTERKRGAPLCSPPQSGKAGQLPRQGGAVMARRVVAPRERSGSVSVRRAATGRPYYIGEGVPPLTPRPA